MLKKIKKILKHSKEKYGWFGDFRSWEEAQARATGYSAENILEKTQESLLKIKNGEAVYERDSVLFDKKEYSFPIIAALLKIAIENNNVLNVIDFGGSLGSTWYQVRDFLPSIISVNWTIVEQEAYVKRGKQYFEDDQLKFAFDIEEVLDSAQCQVILLSSVVQYLEKPHEFLKDLSTKKPKFILFDRTAFLKGGSSDRLTLQIVPPDVYRASYPSWFFNEQQFLAHFEQYKLIAEFAPVVEAERDISIDGKPTGYDKGFLFRLS